MLLQDPFHVEMRRRSYENYHNNQGKDRVQVNRLMKKFNLDSSIVEHLTSWKEKRDYLTKFLPLKVCEDVVVTQEKAQEKAQEKTQESSQEPCGVS